MAEEKKGVISEKAKEETKVPIPEAPVEPILEAPIQDVKARIEEQGELKSEETKFRINVKPEIPVLPEITDREKLDVRYPVIEPYAYIHIHWDVKEQELIYEVEEPILDNKEIKILKTIEDGIEELINISFLGIKTPESVIAFLEKNIKVLLNELGIKISEESFLKLMYYVYRDFVGLNAIEPLMKDYFIEDIECNGVQSPIYIVHRKYRNLRTNVIFNKMERLTSFVEKLAQKCGKYISYASPVLDAALPDGSRINCTYTQEITSKGPTFCIKEGLVQLKDGTVKEISEFFEDMKNKYGSIFENGVEVIDIKEPCVGINEDTLKQKESKAISILKLPPPDKLVTVKLADGAELTTTTNHLFHVIKENKIELIPASELKPGDIIPVPTKINVKGKQQKIDLKSIIKKYLDNYENLCIKIDDKITNTIKNYLRNQNSKLISGKFRKWDGYFKEILSGKAHAISADIFLKICEELKKEIDFEITIIIKNKKGYGSGKYVKIPYTLNEDLAYIIGLIISDGHLNKNLFDISCYEEDNYFKNKIKEYLTNLFGKYQVYYKNNRFYVCNKFLSFYLNDIFKIPFGKKSLIVTVPELIFKSNNKIIAAFLRGLFDGDGSTKSNLSYKSKSKRLVSEISYLLERFGIYNYLTKDENDMCYIVNIPALYRNKFAEKISFLSTRKKCELALLEKNSNKEKGSYYQRAGRMSILPLLNTLKLFNLSKNKFCRDTKISYNTLYQDTISKPLFNKALDYFKDIRNIKENPIISYMNKLNRMNQEYVKIKDVNKFDNVNKFPVYDLELNPCKFFIGGNKPMNVFDTIRKFTKEPWSPIKMMEFKTVSPEMLAYLWLLIEHEKNVMVIGGTGSGKTSFINVMAFFIKPEARIVTIEDTRELALMHENWLPSVARAGMGTTGKGEITLFDLLRASFRQRPDYVIVGEVRGQEAFVLFQGMASGHSAMGTMHADDVGTMIKRLETPPISLSPTLVEAMDAVVIMTQAKYQKKAVRKCAKIVEIISVSEEKGKAQTNTPFIWDPRTNKFFYKLQSYVFDTLVTEHGLVKEDLMKEFSRRTKLLVELYKRKIVGFEDVQKVIHEYYRVPEEVLKRFNIQ